MNSESVTISQTPAELVREAAAKLRAGSYTGTSTFALVAELLEHIGDDMSDYDAHERQAAIGPVVHHENGDYRTDWTAALALARKVLLRGPR